MRLIKINKKIRSTKCEIRNKPEYRMNQNSKLLEHLNLVFRICFDQFYIIRRDSNFGFMLV